MFYDVSEVRNDRLTDDILRTQRFLENNLFDDIDHLDLDIMFEIDGNIEVAGFCTQEDYRDYIIQRRSDLRGEELFRTIIHEMVHVKQYVTGVLEQSHEDDTGPRMYWKTLDMTEVSYQDRPWEIEAHKLEDQLYESFKNQHKTV